MKILAIEKELKETNWEEQSQLLKKEAIQVYQLQIKDNIREIYFNEKKQAILILECQDKNEASKYLKTLPLVQKGIIDFTLMELNPYTGFSRIISA